MAIPRLTSIAGGLIAGLLVGCGHPQTKPAPAADFLAAAPCPPRQEYYIQVIKPDPNIDYKITRIAPDPDQKYFIRKLEIADFSGDEKLGDLPFQASPAPQDPPPAEARHSSSDDPVR